MSLCWCFDDMLCLSLNVLLTVHTYLIMPFMFNFCLRIIKCILQVLHCMIYMSCKTVAVFLVFLSLKAPELLSKHDVPRGWSDQASDPKWNASAEMFDPIYTWWLHVNVIADYSTTNKLLTSPPNFEKNLHQVAPWSWQTVLLHDLGSIPVCIVCAHHKNILWKSAKPFIFSEVPHQVALDQDIVQWPCQGKQTWYQSASCCKVTAIRRPFDHWKRLNLESRSSELN